MRRHIADALIIPPFLALRVLSLWLIEAQQAVEMVDEFLWRLEAVLVGGKAQA